VTVFDENFLDCVEEVGYLLLTGSAKNVKENGQIVERMSRFTR